MSTNRDNLFGGMSRAWPGRWRDWAVAAALLVVCCGATPAADEVRLGGRVYATVRTARHTTYNCALKLEPSPGSDRFERIDLLLPEADPETKVRFLWDGDGCRLERLRGQETDTIAGTPAPVFESLRDGGALTLKRRRHWFEVVAEGRRILRLLDASVGPGDIAAARGKDLPGVAEAAYQRVEPVVFGDDFMRTEEETEDFGQWTPQAGDWQLYSVLEQIRANPDARVRKGREPESGRSANPFCLSGKSADGAVILTGHAFWDDYAVGVSVRPAAGDFGLVFGAVDAGTLWLVRWTLTSPGMRPGRLALVRRAAGRDEVVAEASVTGRTDNWYRLEVRAVGSRIDVLIDGASAIRAWDDRSVGGRIGLYARSEHETYFDDVLLRSWSSVRFDHAGALPGHAEALAGEWEAAGLPGDLALRVRASDPEGSLYALGFPGWSGGCFRSLTDLGAGAQQAGLAFAVTDRDNYWRVTWSPKSGGALALTQVADGKAKTVLKASRSLTADNAHELMVDLREDGLIKVLVDDELEFRERCDADLGGRMGLYAAGEGAVEFRDVEAFAEPSRDWEQPVNIDAFADDPYMQGWASPRWAWISLNDQEEGKAGPRLEVHKGDFYGPFRVTTPISNDLAILFGLDEVDPKRGYRLSVGVSGKKKQGVVVLTRNGRRLAKGRFTTKTRTVIPGKQIVDERLGPRPKPPDTVSYGELSLHRDGKMIWVKANGEEVLSVREDEPLAGRGLGMAAVEPLDFGLVSVLRAQVKDYLFERAPTDWLQVGAWEVTNRFACDPRWSHMNGRSKGVAVLWNKHEFEGDYTIEYYAGMRMRQGEMHEGGRRNHYPRVGDINVALSADGRDLFSGCNLIFAAWDPWWSEKWTQFWRGERMLKETNREFIPRTRDHRPGKRAIEVDWDPGGRAIHGAWYFIKVRKTGNKFDVSFDNVPVFSVTDAAPLTGNRLALWTQHNSIVIARVKIGYRVIATSLPAGSVPPPADSAPVAVGPGATLRSETHPGRAYDFEAGRHGWAPLAGDQSAELLRRPGGEGRGEWSLEMRNLYAGGDFGVRIPVEGLDLGRIAALEMDCAVPGDVRVNLYVTFKDDPLERCFVALSGPDDDAPNLVRIGRFAPFEADGSWRRVRFEPAAALRARFPWRAAFVVEQMALGALHEGYLNTGLGGNKQDASWQLDNVTLTAVGPQRARFVWEAPDEAPPRYRFLCSPDVEAGERLRQAKVGVAPEILLASLDPGLWRLHAAVEEEGAWRRLPALTFRAEVPLAVSETVPAASRAWGGEPIVVRFGAGAELDLSRVGLTAGDETVRVDRSTTTYDRVGRLLTIAVAGAGVEFADGEEVEFALTYGDNLYTPPSASDAAEGSAGSAAWGDAGLRTHRWSCRLEYAADRTPPTRVRLSQEQYRLLDFDDGLQGVAPFASDSRIKISRTPRTPGAGDFALRVLNRVCGSDFGVRLIPKDFLVGKFPVLTFDYRVDPLARVDFMLKRGRQPVTVGFTDCEAENMKLGDIPKVQRDAGWHSAEVDLSALAKSEGGAYSPKMYDANELALGDWGYAAAPPGVAYEIDNVALVPVIATRNGHRLSWSAGDASGIKGYSYLWSEEPRCEVDEVLETSENWVEFTDVPEGTQFLHVRAQDRAGNWGAASHYRFIVDNTPPEVLSVSPAPGSGAAQSKVAIRLKDGASRIDPSTFELRINGAACALNAQTSEWDPVRGELTWDLLGVRRISRKVVPDGKEMTFRLKGVKDFAGNRIEPYEWTWRIEYAKDKEGPLPPSMWSYTHDFRQYDHFTGDIGMWRAQGGKGSGAELSSVIDPKTGDYCLRLEKVKAGGNFSAFRYRGNTEVSDQPIISFDYKFMPSAKMNLLLQVDGKWRAVRLTGGDRIPLIGSVPGAKADGKWRRAEIDLARMLRESMPGVESPKVRSLALGEFRADPNAVGTCVYIDNFAILGPAAPVPVVSFGATDVTGISGFEVGFDRDPLGKPTREAPASGARIPLGGANEAGMWYVHARARDGAGNWGRAIHYPYQCVEPLLKRDADGLEAEEGWTAYATSRRARCLLHPTETPDGGNKFLAAELFVSGKSEIEIRRHSLLRVKESCRVLADLYHQAGEPLRVAAYLRPKFGAERIVSKTVEIESGRWTRNVRFEFDRDAIAKHVTVKGAGLLCREAGLVVTLGGKVRASLVIDHVRIAGLFRKR